MRLYYDLHIHSALSPCADDDMTPNNIVNMAAIKGLDVIAITDHNSCKNTYACAKAAEIAGLKLVVIAGMEVETAEEIHVVCLFPSVEAAMAFDSLVEKNLPAIKNKSEIFGRQRLMDESDNVTGELDNLLLTATKLDLYTVVKKAGELSGIAIPAHIDRNSYSVLSSLGFIPPDLSVPLIEISKHTEPAAFIERNKRLLSGHNKYVISSDAHNLADISEKNSFIEIDSQEKLTAKTIIDRLLE